MGNVEFETWENKGFSSRSAKLQEKRKGLSLSDQLIKRGWVKTPEQASMVLLAVSVVCILLSVFILFKDNYHPAPETHVNTIEAHPWDK